MVEKIVPPVVILKKERMTRLTGVPTSGRAVREKRFVGEAFRVLKAGGLLKVVEVRSRFEDASIDEFVAGCRSAGFDLAKPYDASNRMFVAFDFQKSSRRPSKTDPAFAFRACVYKKR